MALPHHLVARTRLTGHPGLRNSIPWDNTSFSLPGRLCLSPDSICESDGPPDIWSLLEDLDSCICEKELDLDAVVRLVEETLGISLSLMSTPTWLSEPSGAQRSAAETSNNSLEISSGDMKSHSSLYPSPAHTPQDHLSPIMLSPIFQQYPLSNIGALPKEFPITVTSHEEINDRASPDAMSSKMHTFQSSAADGDDHSMLLSMGPETEESFNGDLYSWLFYQGNLTKSPLPSVLDATSSSSASAILGSKSPSPSRHAHDADEAHSVFDMVQPPSTSMLLSPPPTVKFPSLVRFASPIIQSPSIRPISNTDPDQDFSLESAISFRRSSKSNLTSDTIAAAHIKLQNALRAHDNTHEYRAFYDSKVSNTASNEDSTWANESTPEISEPERSYPSLKLMPKGDEEVHEERNTDAEMETDEERPPLRVHRQFQRVIAEMQLNRSYGPPSNPTPVAAEFKSKARSQPPSEIGEENDVSDEARADAVALRLLEESVFEQQHEKALRVLADRLRETAARKRLLAAAVARM